MAPLPSKKRKLFYWVGSMAIKLVWTNQRASRRRQMDKFQLEGTIRSKDNSHEIPFKVVDKSRGGIGIELKEPLQEGQLYLVTFQKATVVSTSGPIGVKNWHQKSLNLSIPGHINWCRTEDTGICYAGFVPRNEAAAINLRNYISSYIANFQEDPLLTQNL